MECRTGPEARGDGRFPLHDGRGSDANSLPSRMQPPRSPFRERLGTYLLGVAIGCVIAGFIMMGRYQAQQKRNTPAPAPSIAPQSP